MDFNKTFEMNPFVRGAIVAVVYIAVLYLLPKKMQGTKRVVLSNCITIVVSLLIQLIMDLLFGK